MTDRLTSQRLSRSAAARLLGVSGETIRYYTQTNRLASVLNASRHHEYEEHDVRRLARQI
jgi:DNA-binding transcriptional MerR regulator